LPALAHEGAVRHEAARIHELAKTINDRKPLVGRQFDDLAAVGGENHVVKLDECGRALQFAECAFKFAWGLDSDDLQLEPERRGGKVRLAKIFHVPRIQGVRHNGHPGKTGNKLLQQLQTLAHQIGVDAGKPRDVAAGPCETRDDFRGHRVD